MAARRWQRWRVARLTGEGLDIRHRVEVRHPHARRDAQAKVTDAGRYVVLSNAKRVLESLLNALERELHVPGAPHALPDLQVHGAEVSGRHPAQSSDLRDRSRQSTLGVVRCGARLHAASRALQARGALPGNGQCRGREIAAKGP